MWSLLRSRSCRSPLVLVLGLALPGAVLLAACAGSNIPKASAAVAPTGPPIATGSVIGTVAQAGPTSSREQRSAMAACPSGTTLLSGGAQAYLAGGKAPNPSLRLVGTVPGPETAAGPGTAPGSSGAAAGWKAVIATGGVDQAGSRMSSMAVCARGAKIAAPTVVVSNAAGPKGAATDALATATCPPGTVLVGGGAAVSLTNGQPGPPQYFVTGSYPSAADGRPATTGRVPTSWTAIGALGGMPMTGGRVQAVADCVPGKPASVSVVVVTLAGPTKPMSAQLVTATCPRHSILVGGGVYAGAAKIERPLQGLHLRGSFPSGPAGAGVANGSTADSWSVVANSGGVIAVGARSSSFALCSAT